MKRPTEFDSEEKRKQASEQGLFQAAVLGADVAVISDGQDHLYVDVARSLAKGELAYLPEERAFGPGVLESILQNSAGKTVDPAPLISKVWQAIWHATQAEPRACLMTFVEVFVLKFLSDNLSSQHLAKRYSFYELTAHDEDAFQKQYGRTQIEYYVETIRPEIKKVFPDKTVVASDEVKNLFGHSTLVSNTSIINGFAFLRSGSTSLESYNHTFVKILEHFEAFGPLRYIDPEFKLRLYESFLKKSKNSQSRLGQFFTPRNVVKSMIKMAQMSSLPDDAVVYDPAAGVGGFVLEPLIDPEGLPSNVTFENGEVNQRVRLVGADVDKQTHILAKANTLIHLAEEVRNPSVTPEMLNRLMSELFVTLDDDEMLGTLEYPVDQSVDLILTNPPYVTQGSAVYKERIARTVGPRNGKTLKDYYGGVGLGVESLFLRLICGALKPGARAFVIVPQGMLTRTETSTKETVLKECNLLVSIALPRNTFFNTPQKTYILCLERRHTAVDDRPDVFCAIASSIGESLDAERVETPEDNTLREIAQAFVDYQTGGQMPGSPARRRIKLEAASAFKSTDRWDVHRFWSDDELVAIGEREEAVDRVAFIEEISSEMQELLEELPAVRAEIEALTSGTTLTVSLSDSYYFNIRSGKRITRAMARENPGDVPVYSGKKDPNDPIGRVSESWARQQGIPVEENPILTVNANGSVGKTFVRREKCIIHDDVKVIEVKHNDFDIDFVASVLRSVISAKNFEYEAKLYSSKLEKLHVEVPIEDVREYTSDDGETHRIASFNCERQRQIADAYKKFDTMKQRMEEIGNWAGEARIR